jgi:hypothetical protein
MQAHTNEVEAWVDALSDIPSASSKQEVKNMFADQDCDHLDTIKECMTQIEALDAFKNLKLGVRAALKRALQRLDKNRVLPSSTSAAHNLPNDA